MISPQLSDDTGRVAAEDKNVTVQDLIRGRGKPGGGPLPVPGQFPDQRNRAAVARHIHQVFFNINLPIVFIVFGFNCLD